MEDLVKNQIYTVTVDGFSSEGFGVARINERAVFIPGALPGEEWDVRIHKVTSSAVYAGAVELHTPSPDRIEPDCPYYGRCGGCGLRHMSYGAELRFKLSRVNEAIKRIGGLDFQISEIIGSEQTEGYRNKGIFSVGLCAGKPAAGFYRPRSHDIIPIDRCLIQQENTAPTVRAVLDWMAVNGIQPYDENTGRGSVRHIFTRSAVHTGESMLCIVSAKGFGSSSSSLVDAVLAARPDISSIILCINKGRLNTVLDGEFYTLWGNDRINEELCSLRFTLSPLSFFQINPPQAEKLYAKALEYASPDGDALILDLYCGTGTISLCLARGAKRVIGAEIVSSAVEDARRNAEANGIGNVDFICADASDAAAELARRGLEPDTVVVDPPRKGLAADVIGSIVSMSPKRIVYVSCDPGTLARDMKLFAANGFIPECGSAVDMFPRTHHVETVVLLSKGEIDSKESV